MLGKLFKGEIKHFRSFSPDLQRFLLVILLYTFAYPFLSIFANAFLWRQSKEVTQLLIYNFGFFAGLSAGFILNGYLLRKYQIKALFFAGMVLSILSVLVMVQLGKLSTAFLFINGTFTGIGAGFYWANKSYLTLLCTTDENRNYFYGLNHVLITTCQIISPLLFGGFIGLSESLNWMSTDLAYQILSIFVLLVVITSGLVFYKGKYKTPEITTFTYRNFPVHWNGMRGLSFMISFLDGGLMILPTLLVLKFVGNETSLGIVGSLSTVVSLIAIYITGRIAKPTERIKMMFAGSVFMFLGTIAFSLSYNALGVIIFQLCYIIASPLLHSSYAPMMLKSIEDCNKISDIERYSYICDAQHWTNGARILAGLTFLVMYHFGGLDVALRYVFFTFCLAMVGAIYYAKKSAAPTKKVSSPIWETKVASA